MNRTHALAVAAAAFLAVPAFAQNCTLSSDNLQMICPGTTILGAGPVMSSNGAPITSGTGVVVKPGTPLHSVAVAPSAADVALVPGHRVLPGAAVVQASQTTVLTSGPAAAAAPAGQAAVLGAGSSATLPAASGSQTVVTRYWVNVPANVTSRPDFQRWTHLKP
jgi:hypothetical protein